jgi:hypothetical protein
MCRGVTSDCAGGERRRQAKNCSAAKAGAKCHKHCATCALGTTTKINAVTVCEQLRANDENRAANQTAPADKGGMFDGVAKIGRIAMRAFVNGSE